MHWANSMLQNVRKTTLSPIHTYHAVLLPCRFAKSLGSLFPIWFTQCGRVWFTHAMPRPFRSHAMPRPCRSEGDLSRPRHNAAWERHSVCELSSAVQRQHMGQRSASSDYHAEFRDGCYQKHTNLRLAVRIFPATTWSSMMVVTRSIPISD
jgi:hypothetical protein